MENIITPKSRGTGATWMAIALCLHQSIFFNDVEIGLISAAADDVDQIDNPSTLFGKVDVLMRYMPEFLIPKRARDRGPMRWVNRETRGTMHGSASTGDAFRGHRKTAVVQDESAKFPKGADEAVKDSLVEVTDCNIDISTLARDDSKKFNRIAWDADWPGVRLFIRWWECPPMAAGLYTTDDDGKLKIIDTNHRFPQNFKFTLDPSRPGKYRSPWYDRKTKAMRPDAVAREYDVDRESGRGAALDQTTIKGLLKKQLEAGRLEPLSRGELSFDVLEKTAAFRADTNGRLLLWCPMAGGKPIIGEPLVFGTDVSGGTGASSSVISIFGAWTGKQWGEYASAHDDPIRLARLAASLGWWMMRKEDGEPIIVSEVQGPGGTFLAELKRLKWSAFYRRTTKGDQFDRPTQKIGYAASHDGVGQILHEVIAACAEGKAEIRSERCFTEFAEYVWKDGKIVHGGATSKQDASEGKDTHGDRACAAALAWVGCSKYVREEAVAKVDEPAPWGSLLWARENGYLGDVRRDEELADLYAEESLL